MKEKLASLPSRLAGTWLLGCPLKCAAIDGHYAQACKSRDSGVSRCRPGLSLDLQAYAATPRGSDIAAFALRAFPGTMASDRLSSGDVIPTGPSCRAGSSWP